MLYYHCKVGRSVAAVLDPVWSVLGLCIHVNPEELGRECGNMITRHTGDMPNLDEGCDGDGAQSESGGLDSWYKARLRRV